MTKGNIELGNMKFNVSTMYEFKELGNLMSQGIPNDIYVIYLLNASIRSLSGENGFIRLW